MIACYLLCLLTGLLQGSGPSYPSFSSPASHPLASRSTYELLVPVWNWPLRHHWPQSLSHLWYQCCSFGSRFFFANCGFCCASCSSWLSAFASIWERRLLVTGFPCLKWSYPLIMILWCMKIRDRFWKIYEWITYLNLNSGSCWFAFWYWIQYIFYDADCILILNNIFII